LTMAAALGVPLDPWQGEVLTDSSRMTGGRWSAFEVATILPRQNGKSYLAPLRALAGALLYGERLVIYSAHEYRTAQETWRLMRDLCESDAVAPHVKRVRMMAGGEVVEFRNGCRFKMIARTRTSGRGFSPDCLLLDEAFALSGDVMSALLPSLAARPNPQVWYLSSAGTWESEVLLGIRRRGHGPATSRLAYWEWHAEPTDDHRDPRVWARTNPAYGRRLTYDSVSRELGALSKRSFMRERCGVWTETFAETVMREEDVNACTVTTPRPPVDGRVIGWGVDATPDRSGAVIAAAFRDDGGVPVALVVDARPGAGWVPQRLGELSEAYRVDTIAYDSRGGVTDLVDRAHREHDVPVTPMRYEQYPTACANLAQRMAERTVRIGDAPALVSDAVNATAQTTGNGWVWSRRTATVPTHLIAATGALWALERNDGGSSVGVY
jgi:phage terminase large subunit-like protein